MPKKLKGGTLWVFSPSILSQNSKKLEGGPFGKIFIPKEKTHNAKKTERRDPLVSSGIVCYPGNLFGSVPWANGYNLASSQNFVEFLVELFWSYFRCVEKKLLTKSHDYSGLFSLEKRQLKRNYWKLKLSKIPASK